MYRRLVVPATLIVVSALNSWWFVFGSGIAAADSPLAGKVLLAALMGGGGGVLSAGAMLVLAPLAAVVGATVRAGVWDSTAERRRTSRGIAFLAGFAAGFVVVISGTPAAVAGLVYGFHHRIELAGGTLLLLYGIAVVAQPIWTRTRGPRAVRWPAWMGAAGAGLLGLATALVLAHELDPLYDSVFFRTGNAVAASHAPLTVTVFVLGLSLVVSSLGVLTLFAGHPVVGRWVLGGLRMTGGLVTVSVGAALLSGQFGTIRALLLP